MRVLAYSTTLLVSAFLLFSIQPMVARFVLPHWGGGSGVWSVCLLFFQAALLIGYLYAHLLAQFFSVRAQSALHIVLLLGAVVILFLGSISAVPTQHVHWPSLQLLWELTRQIGIPCILLSATAPLLQHWLAQDHGRSAYRLYAVSNLGSLLGLLCYPLLLEPLLGLTLQEEFWRAGYLLLAVCSIACAVLAKPAAVAIERAEVPALPTLALWLAFSAAGVVVLLSVTTEITVNLVPMPLLWAVPLALYLVTFIWCFASNAPYSRRPWLSLFSLTVLPTLWLPAIEPLVGVWPSVALSCLTLFSGCMICHGELAKTKPEARNLSLYYVFLAAGGVIGSALINFAAPFVFARNWDLSFGLFFVLVLAGIGIIATPTKRESMLEGVGPKQQRIGLGAIALWAMTLSAFAFIGTLPLRAQRGTLASDRSFFGTLSVVDSTSEGRRKRSLLHGRIRHGAQNLGADALVPTLYFSTDSGVGIVLAHAAYPAPRNIGVVGLGAGTLASYGQLGDQLRFYELDPLVVSFAERYFSFLQSSPATISIVVGDGRLSMKRELRKTGSNSFDVLVIDAFNADAVPTHLLTREAFHLYWQHLDTNGTLALNITNAFLNLGPVIQAHARDAGKQSRIVKAAPSEHSQSGSTWMLVTNNQSLLSAPALNRTIPSHPSLRAWTDDYSNILTSLR